MRPMIARAGSSGVVIVFCFALGGARRAAGSAPDPAGIQGQVACIGPVQEPRGPASVFGSITIRLVQRSKVVASTHPQDEGRFSFWRLPAGTYRLDVCRESRAIQRATVHLLPGEQETQLIELPCGNPGSRQGKLTIMAQ